MGGMGVWGQHHLCIPLIRLLHTFVKYLYKELPALIQSHSHSTTAATAISVAAAAAAAAAATTATAPLPCPRKKGTRKAW
jgi:mevalonate pyrophosphate decarboxylase